MSQWAVEIRDAVKRFAENTVVDHVSLDIGPGEFGVSKISGIGRENLPRMLEHYSQTKNLLVSYSTKSLGFS